MIFLILFLFWLHIWTVTVKFVPTISIQYSSQVYDFSATQNIEPVNHGKILLQILLRIFVLTIPTKWEHNILVYVLCFMTNIPLFNIVFEQQLISSLMHYF